LELSGIYDIDDKKSKLAMERGIKAYASLDELIADKEVELVTVAIPNDVHLDTVVRLLKGGKNVICEKPVALSTEEFNTMVATAKECGKLFTVHQNRRWDVDYLAIQSICDSGEIGKPLRIESRIHGSRGIPSDWRGMKEYGGGMILDWGVHLIDQLMLVFKDEKIDGRFKEAYNESAFAVRDDGIITGFARTDRNEPRRQFMVLSNDNGKTWSRPIPSGRLSVYIPLIVKLADHEGHLMVGGWREAYNNCVSMLHSTDGIAWDLIGQAFYQPDNSHKPMNKATGGVQAMVPGPKKHQYYVVFYTHDPKLPGHDKLRLEGNMFEFVPDKK
jgi:hypothetical protein